MKTTKPNVEIYTLPQLVDVLKVSKRTLIQYIKEGRLRAVRIGRSWQVSADNLKAFVNGQQ